MLWSMNSFPEGLVRLPLYLALNNLPFSSSGEPKAQALLVPWPRGPGVFDLSSKSEQGSKFAEIQLGVGWPKKGQLLRKGTAKSLAL